MNQRIVWTTDVGDQRPVWDEGATSRIVWGVQAFVDFLMICDVLGTVPGSTLVGGSPNAQSVSIIPLPAALADRPAVLCIGSPSYAAAIAGRPFTLSRARRPAAAAAASSPGQTAEASTTDLVATGDRPRAVAVGIRPETLTETVGCPK